MAKHLDSDDIENVVNALLEWPADSKLTWDRLLDAISHGYGLNTTRQTLEKKNRIKQAFNETKEYLSEKRTPKSKSLPPSLAIAGERLRKFERKIKLLEFENQKLLEQFQVWLYNAYRHNITIEQLSEPLPRNNDE